MTYTERPRLPLAVAIEKHFKSAIENHTGRRLLYVPWPRAAVEAAAQTEELRWLGQDLAAASIEEPADTAAISRGAWSVKLVEALSGDESLIKKVRAVTDEIAYTHKLEASVFGRLRSCAPRRCLVIANSVDGDGLGWLKWILRATREIPIAEVVVLGPVPPPNEPFKRLEIGWQEFLKHAARWLEQEPTPPAQVQLSDSANGALDSRSRVAALIQWFKSLFEYEGPSAPESVELSAPEARHAPDLKDPRWSLLLAHATFPTLTLAGVLAKRWSEVSEVSETESNAVAAQPPDQQDSRPVPEILALRGRLRFLETLKLLYPDVFAAAMTDLDGCDQLYRLQLTVCGGAQNEQLMGTPGLLPHWHTFLTDIRLLELFRIAFMGDADRPPLIPRFESRTQLSLHLRWQENGGRFAASGAKKYLDTFYEWVEKVRAAIQREPSSGVTTPSEATRAAPPSSEPPALDLDLDDVAAEADLRPFELLEIALMKLSEVEIFYEDPGVDQNERVESGRGDLQAHLETQEEALRAIKRLVSDAMDGSSGALHLECTLTKARIAALRGDMSAAHTYLREVRWRSTDPLVPQAINLQKAFILECEKKYPEAIAKYDGVLEEAEKLAADELCARAVWGSMRCSASMKVGIKPQFLRKLRATVMVQVQTTRAPHLHYLNKRQKPLLFTSYRTLGAQRLTECVQDGLQKNFTPWWDRQLVKREEEDFSPTLHAKLLDADAIVLMLSPEYFDSRWCTHELDFALGQHDVRGVLIFWCWCDKSAHGDARVAQLLSGWRSAATGAAGEDKERRHFGYYATERLERLQQYGTRLDDSVVANDGDEPQLKATAARLVARIEKKKAALYRRAGLEVPTRPISVDSTAAAQNAGSDMERVPPAPPAAGTRSPDSPPPA